MHVDVYVCMHMHVWPTCTYHNTQSTVCGSELSTTMKIMGIKLRLRGMIAAVFICPATFPAASIYNPKK